MVIDTVVTHPDWVAAWGNWGRVGVQRIIDACKSAGIRRIYWRTACGARVFYWSNLEEIYKGEAQEACEKPEYWKVTLARCDYRIWDPLKDAVACASDAGIELWVWYSLFEESHLQACLTRFAEQYPQYWWTSRDGQKRASKLSFSFLEVRRHKLAMITEMMGYGAQGLLLDYVRQLPQIGESCPPQTDSQGVCQYGYEEPAIHAYKGRYGIDPREISNETESWIHHRANYVTQFMRELRQDRVDSELVYPVAILVQPPSALGRVLPDWRRYVTDGLVAEGTEWRAHTDALRGSLVDWSRWIEEGLIDELHVMMPEWNLARLIPDFIQTALASVAKVVKDRCPMLTGLYCYNMDQLGLEVGAANLEAGALAARAAGSHGLVLWESTAIESWSGWDKYLPSGLWKTVLGLSDL